VTQGAQTKQTLDAIAWKFVGSEFADQTYADWPIERRLDGYPLRHGLVDIFDDGVRARRCSNASWTTSVAQSATACCGVT
jgi:hypothetical protein